MALNIKDGDTDRLARELAEVTGESITDAVRVALEERLASLRRRARVTSATDLREIIARGRQRRTLDHRSEDEILGYGEDGFPA